MNVSQKIWTREFAVGTDADIRAYAEHRDDRNPLHHDSEAAKRNGLLGIIAPGMLAIEHVSAAIGNQIPEVMLHQITMKFTKPLYAGAMPSVVCTIARQRRISADVDIEVHNGYDLVAMGSCELLLPRR